MARRVRPHLPVESLPCAAVYVDAIGRILSANAPFERLWSSSGCGEHSPVGADVFTMLAEDDRMAVHGALAMRTPARPSVRAITLRGSAARVDVELVPLRRGRRKGTIWLVMLRPTAGEPWGERSMHEALAAGILHDLRAPLQVVLGWASLLKRKPVDAGRLEHALTIIERNARVQLDLLEDLLELSQPPWARAPLRRAPVDLVELVTAVVRGLEPVAEQRGVRLILGVTPPVVVVDGHDFHLHRVVTNLVTNAMKFTPSGGTVECRLSCAARSARLVISDTGRGIPPELLLRVFEPFIQEPGGEPHGGGVGLGLWIVKHLVELHGGQVTAESPGLRGGATFTVLLPEAPQVRTGGEMSSLSREVRALPPAPPPQAAAHVREGPMRRWHLPSGWSALPEGSTT